MTIRHLSPWILLLGAAACGGGATEEAAEPAGGVVTLWTDSTELFMEHPALIVGEPGVFAVHLTDLTDFAPLRSGRVTLRFEPRGGGDALTVVQETPRRPGIYGPRPEFTRPGVYDLTITVESPQARDVIRVPGLPVYASAAEAPPDTAAEEGGIPFLKEQQWQTPGMATAFAATGSVAESFSAAGEIVPAGGRLAIVAAPVGGLVDAAGVVRSPAPGQRVTRGQVLAELTPSLSDGGSVARARQELREAQDELERARRLVAAEAAPARRLHEAEIRLDAAREALAGLGVDTAAGGGRVTVRAPIGGIVASRAITPGSRVEAGTQLFTIVDPSLVWIETHVPADRVARVRPGSTATFRVAGSDRVFTARRLVAVGGVVDSLSRTVLVIYEAANPGEALKIGATATVAVRTGVRAQGVTVPSSAILDEDGRPIAYVQLSGERFEKRELTLGGDDGTRAVVLGGIRAGERVVTGAAYQVRLASLSTSVPAEGHAH
jgi:membrane fusion protein, heavy metal efflux system